MKPTAHMNKILVHTLCVSTYWVSANFDIVLMSRFWIDGQFNHFGGKCEGQVK